MHGRISYGPSIGTYIFLAYYAMPQLLSPTMLQKVPIMLKILPTKLREINIIDSRLDLYQRKRKLKKALSATISSNFLAFYIIKVVHLLSC